MLHNALQAYINRDVKVAAAVLDLLWWAVMLAVIVQMLIVSPMRPRPAMQIVTAISQVTHDPAFGFFNDLRVSGGWNIPTEVRQRVGLRLLARLAVQDVAAQPLRHLGLDDLLLGDHLGHAHAPLLAGAADGPSHLDDSRVGRAGRVRRGRRSRLSRWAAGPGRGPGRGSAR